jgi:hypothetical protein
MIEKQKYAAGGLVTGGIPGQDSVPALLMPGEFVLPKPTVDLLRGVNVGFGGNFAAATQQASAIAEGGGASSVTHDNSSLTVNFGHVMGGRTEARRIVRMLDQARMRDQGRSVR